MNTVLMAFESRTLVNGQWVTRTLDVSAVLQHYDQEDRDARPTQPEVEKPPVLGLLTQTVIRSPLVHWILPVRIRNEDHNDVAFIGDDFVQIKELRPDIQLWDVIRMENFGARIRNARILGSIKVHSHDKPGLFGSSQKIKDEDDDYAMDAAGLIQKRTSLPPQLIVLQLDTGDTVFLMLRKSGVGKLEFVSSRHRVPKAMLKLQPGMHLSIDPSSRYVAVGCSEALFSIYALRPRSELSEQCRQGSRLDPILLETYISVRGVILKLEFLYPSPGDGDHIILLVLLVSKGKTRMLLYEWEAGGDFRNIRSRNRRGHLLDNRRQQPLLLIPLTIKSSFILIYEDLMTVCQRLLEGVPEFLDFNQQMRPPTEFHHGRGNPLWAAWTRPKRMSHHRAHRDDLYIVREDGLVNFIEIDSELDDFVKADMNVGQLNGNCSPALACLDNVDLGGEFGSNRSGDMLVSGGDSSAGGTYLITARKTPKFTEPIQNWSPAVDFVTTYVPSNEGSTNEWAVARRKQKLMVRPNKIFACTGKGSQGAIAELRFGFEAKLGLMMDYETQIMDAWVLSASFDSDDIDSGSLILLSLGNKSKVLRLNSRADQADIPDEETCKFDLRYRTITTNMLGSSTVQVTEQSIVTINSDIQHLYEEHELLLIRQDENFLGTGSMIDNAIIYEHLVIFTTQFENNTYLQILEQHDSPNADIMETDSAQNPGRAASVRTLGACSFNTTCIGVCMAEKRLWAITAELENTSVFIKFTSIDNSEQHKLSPTFTYQGKSIDVEPIVSIAVTYRLPGCITILCGTRNGLVLTLEMNELNFELMGFGYDRVGLSQVIVKKDENQTGSQVNSDFFFVNCDSHIYALTPGRSRSNVSRIGRTNQDWNIHQIWLTEASNTAYNQPEINSVTRLLPNITAGPDGGLLFVAGSELLLASFSTQTKPVPRYMPTRGTPTRLLYSETLNVIIVACIVDGKSALLLVDPSTGEDLSSPIDSRTKERVDFLSGLGNSDDRIYHLLEWTYVKDTAKWCYIVVATSSGRLLIIQAVQTVPTANPDTVETGMDPEVAVGRRPKIEIHIRHKFKYTDPVYSVIGFSEGLLWCSGNQLFCDTLELKEKRFRRIATYELLSPVTSLMYDNGTIYALTIRHSLEVLKLVTDDNGVSSITHTHVDQVARNSLHHTLIELASGRPIHLISDKDCSIAGLWSTQGTKADTLEAIFEAQLPHSILKFRPGRCRPRWDPVWSNSNEATIESSLDIIPRSKDAPELLGISIDGSLSHYSLLNLTTWKFLRFLINLAIRSPIVCEFTFRDEPMLLEPTRDPKILMHVDGDILRRCLDEQHLEILLHVGEDSYQASRIFAKFCELLQGLHKNTLPKNAGAAVYVEQAYEDLAYFLRPVV